eukprot:CAMPEP_0114503336 /NCGR_PEP_ID=MMETSP0109-20121206/9593_1 /TAXON_ID=29199 /ORGANISM="Chlorarachnion reptans, Strain CCCM449" /LENGTH=563 /DNA_ID=CAMNT_0001681357 /DNA_START=54 /DNA_END=1745 /DNA_ORIENTATION=-
MSSKKPTNPADRAEAQKLVSGLLTLDARKILAEATLKYPEVKRTVEAKVISSEVPEVNMVNSRMHQTFKAGVTRDLRWRRQQLTALLKMLREGREVLCGGLKKDLNRSAAEGYFLEVNLVEHGVQQCLDKLSEWTQPSVVGTNLVNLPGSSSIQPDPLGAVLILGCWNYPVQLSLLPLAGAIAAGNSVVLKMPTDVVPHTSAAVIKLAAQYLDKRAIHVMGGGVKENQALLKQRWDKIFFTGSDFVGKIVYQAAAEHLCPVTLEMGGKCPTIVAPSSNIQIAAKRIAWGKWMNAGQTCVAPDHIFVHESIADHFLEMLERTVKDFYGKNPKESKFFCRLATERHTNRVKGLLDEHSDKVIFGGEVDVKSKYIAPTVMYFKDDWKTFTKSKIMGQEIFGPLLPVVKYNDQQKVIDYINAGEKPLSLYIFSNNKSEIKSVMTKTSSGAALVNDVAMHLSNEELPFGGVGHSGIGAYHGKFSFDCFSHKKAVLKRPDASILDIPARYPPYSNWKVSLLGFVQTVRPAWQMNLLKYSALFFLAALLARNRRRAAQILHSLIDLVLGV